MKTKLDKILHMLGRYWFFILIGIWFVWALCTGGFNSDNTSSTLPAPAPAAAADPLPTPTTSTATAPATPPVSLTTGTILKSRSAYLSGDGELTISNGTGGDAVIKLISGGTSIFTVYIQKGDSYTIKNIADGTYRVAFDQGTNWDSATGTFTNDQGSEYFEDILDFETTSDNYTTYTLGLNPVEGGTAQTDNVSSAQFSQY